MNVYGCRWSGTVGLMQRVLGDQDVLPHLGGDVVSLFGAQQILRGRDPRSGDHLGDRLNHERQLGDRSAQGRQAIAEIVYSLHATITGSHTRAPAHVTRYMRLPQTQTPHPDETQ